MTLGRLILRNTLRRPVRLALTVWGLAMVVLAFGLIRLTLDEWQGAAKAASKNRLIAVHAMSGALSLPLAYRDRIAVLPGVRSVHYGVEFGGIYKDPKQPLASFAEPAATLLTTYPEILLSERERLAFVQDRRGCIVGLSLAERYGWKPGDVIPLTGTIYPGQWEVIVRGIYRSSNLMIWSDQELFLQWDYLNEQVKTTQPDRVDQVSWYAIDVKEGSNPRAVALAIDALFANSFAETRTELEQAFIAGWVERSSALLYGLEAVSAVINGIALLVLVNALAMAVRERTREYAVIKALGFQPRHFCVLVLGESLLLALCGGALGLGLLVPASRLYAQMTQSNGYVATYAVSMETAGLCLGMMVLVALGAAFWPAVRLIRMTTLDGLRHAG